MLSLADLDGAKKKVDDWDISRGIVLERDLDKECVTLKKVDQGELYCSVPMIKNYSLGKQLKSDNDGPTRSDMRLVHDSSRMTLKWDRILLKSFNMSALV